MSLHSAAMAWAAGTLAVMTFGAQPAPAPAHDSLPSFAVTTADGKAAVYNARSGQRIAAISRPSGVYAFEGVSVAADDRTVFLAGAKPGSPWEVVFFQVRLAANGKPGAVRQLPGRPLAVPMPVISGGWINVDLAASPDGRELAFGTGTPVPYGPGTSYGPPAPTPGNNEGIVVQDVATGARRTWHAWGSAQAVVTQFSWGASGQLGYDLTAANATVSHGALGGTKNGKDVGAFLVLSTTRSGSDLIRDSRLVVYRLAAKGTPVPPQGVIGPDGKTTFLQLAAASGQTGQLAMISGSAARVLLSGYRAALGDPMSVGGGYLLFPARLANVKVGNSQAPYQIGRMARIDVRTGQLTVLPIPVMAEINGAFDASW